MTAREQYRLALWVMRSFGIEKHNHIHYDRYLAILSDIRADILLKAWQSL